MIRFSVFYPTTEGASFDHDYYLNKHVPLAVKTWGLSGAEIDDVHEVVVAANQGGGRLQLAERYNGGQDIDHGFALWKAYFNVDDCQAVYDKAMAWGCESQLVPTRLDRWPVIAAFFYDPDGYLIEILQYVDGATSPAASQS